MGLANEARVVEVQLDEEHNLYTLEIEDRTAGYARHASIGAEFIASGEYPGAAHRVPGHQGNPRADGRRHA